MRQVTQTLKKEKKNAITFHLVQREKKEGDPALPIYPLFLLQVQVLVLKTF